MKLFSTILYIIIISLASITFIGCDDWMGCDDCNDLIDDEEDKRGAGDCSSYEWSGGSWCVDCWWWSQGVSKTWCQWEDDCKCDESTYKFSPIYSSYDVDVEISCLI